MAAGSREQSTVNSQRFHHHCGRRITLLNDNLTAVRSERDFNHALVFSAAPVKDDFMFEVVIDQKNHSWGGSIEIGVTAESPDKLDIPAVANALRNGTWVMSGIDVRKDGNCLVEFYGTDLETLNVGDRVGVMRTSAAELIFFVNGKSQGIAAKCMPSPLWALVDLYGRCVQVTIWSSCNFGFADVSNSRSLGQINHNVEIPINFEFSLASKTGSIVSADNLEFMTNSAHNSTSNITTAQSVQNVEDYYNMNERIRFHTRCGSLVKLSSNCRSAERRRPLDEFNNAVVMTQRPLKDDEVFEIRLDKLVDKWSGSIEVGVTTHNPSILHFPATMTNMRSGTIMMSGCGILTNGKGTRRQYGEFNLDELREGDRIGMMRSSIGNLHYYINGQDQGIAATRVAATLWGVIDLYGMTIKVTIVDRDEREQQNLVTRRNNTASSVVVGVLKNTVNGNSNLLTVQPINNLSPENEVTSDRTGSSVLADRLTFHPTCGSHATVTYGGRTALRPNASDDFNNGVVLTRRPLRSNELFQIRLERVVTKWAGSVEMGVTTHSAEDLEFPFTMTNVRSGTWMMTGNGVMHNGVTVIEQYGLNLDRLQVGDRVGVVRKYDGTLHFWVNGIDQGPAAHDVPENVYGVIDLYGQAAQASIVETSECGSPDTGNSTISNTTLCSEPPLRFHAIHGKNANISNGGLTASRPNSLAEFNDAIVFSNRPLQQREIFEVVIESVVRHWSGNIEIGVIGTRPEDIRLTSNATDLNSGDSIILCGSMIFYNSNTIRTYTLIDLDTLTVGTRVGVMRNGDFVHFFIDGVDQGPACECFMQNAWAVIDLYGQCAVVTLTQIQNFKAPYAISENSQSCLAPSVLQTVIPESKHRWNSICGNITLSQNWTVASRLNGPATALSPCIVFSEHPMCIGTPFEIKIASHNPLIAGCFNIGITDLNLAEESIRKNIPPCIKKIPANVWYMSANEMRYNSVLLRHSLASLEWLRVGDRITLELTTARTLRILFNSEDINIHFQNISNDVYVVVELQGSTTAVQVISSQGPTSPLQPYSLRLQDSLDFGADVLNKQDSMLESIESESQSFEFLDYHGKNVRLTDEHLSAARLKSYNQGIVSVTKPLRRGESISIRIDNINTGWKGTIGLGVIGIPLKHYNLIPTSILQFKRPCWLVTHDVININGQKLTSKYGEVLELLKPGIIITMTLTHAGVLGNTNLEDLAICLPNNVYPIFDLYGLCEKISLINENEMVRNSTPIIEELPVLEHDGIHNRHTGACVQCEKANLEVHEKEHQELKVTAEHAGFTTTAVQLKTD
ncbi:neuralized-like protein 4 isoform X2 [Teleopsis dalmanni]|uniref:neuralized-like protein 4 isoform X2 n=1 Tax=Teleopsis dalmanni TaxID=139649 RepID=UPI0018CFC380|nr:neuralized-like protein 4 isoform X2 [Teleopsis dalmanni]